MNFIPTEALQIIGGEGGSSAKHPRSLEELHGQLAEGDFTQSLWIAVVGAVNLSSDVSEPDTSPGQETGADL